MESKRQRRYTIARPESALALLTENDELLLQDDQQFDRISDILSNLIQEANQAVSIPLVRKLSNTTHSSNKKKSQKRPISYPSKRSFTPIPISPSSSSTFMTTRKPHVTQIHSTTPVLLESFKRLDSSMAIIDSLSKDLIVPNNTVKKQKKLHRLTFDSRLTALILLPLFHVPHVLISMVFDTISNYDNLMPVTSTTTSNSSSFSGMLIWAFIFAVTNIIMVENTIPSSTPPLKLIPGAFNVKRKVRNSKRNESVKRPLSRQLYLQQHNRAMRMMHDYYPSPSNSTTFEKGHCTPTRSTPISIRARRNSF